MQQVLPGQDNTVGCDVVNKTTAGPIESGTVAAYLCCVDGVNAGKYWDAATATFVTEKTSAGAMAFAGGSRWQAVIAAGAWLPGCSYALFGEESGSLNLVYTEYIVTWSPPTTGMGGAAWTYTVTDSTTTLPIAECEVWASTDSAGVNVVAHGYTNASGQVTFYLSTGVYFVFRRKAGYTFTNPDVEAVTE